MTRFGYTAILAAVLLLATFANAAQVRQSSEGDARSEQ